MSGPLQPLTDVIETNYGEELTQFRLRLRALADQDIGAEGVDGAVTAMTPMASVASQEVSVEVVGFTQGPEQDYATFVVSVAMHVNPRSRPGAVYWDEADAWAHALAGNQWAGVERRDTREISDGQASNYVFSDRDCGPGVNRGCIGPVRCRSALG